MTFDEAVKLLRNAVKPSHLANQPHIDLTLISAAERFKYEKALMITRQEVAQGRISENQLKILLGLL